MNTLENTRFHLVENKNKYIILDVDTSTPYIVDKNQNVDTLLKEISNKQKNLNKDVLEKATYEDGSNFAINLNLTPACNLKCTYCFAQGGDYGQQGKLNMDEDIIPNIEALIRNNITKSRKVRFEYFGGEPLLNFKLIKKILDFCDKFSKEDNIEFIHRISTNLTVINEEIIDALGKNNFIISISIDGTRNVQNCLRPFKNGEGSFDKIMENIKRIREKYPNIKMVARMTLAQKDYSMWDNLKELISTNYFDYASIYPASIKSEDGSPYKYYFDEEIKQQFEYVLEHYNQLLECSARFKGILEVEKILDEILNGKISVSHCGAGGTYCTISSDKTIVTCHRLCGKGKYFLNTSITGKLNQTLKNEWSRKVDDDKICSQCWARYICGGGCKQEHISATSEFIDKNKNSCEYQKLLIGTILKNIDNLSKNFKERFISLDDMFVYCGRPTVSNNRESLELDLKK